MSSIEGEEDRSPRFQSDALQQCGLDAIPDLHGELHPMSRNLFRSNTAANWRTSG